MSYYAHVPGLTSKWGVVDVGLKCMHSCKFCYYSFLDDSDDQFQGMRHAKFHTKEHLVGLVGSLKENGFVGFDVTGGEPTLHPDIVGMIGEANKLGLSSRIITLGQYLLRKMHKSPNMLLDDLIAAGLTNFLFSMHDIDEERFHAITGESWGKLKAAMDELDKRDFHYCSNTTVFEENYRNLPQIAEEITKHNIYLHNFILMNAYYAWSDAGKAAPVQADYDKVYPYLKEAIKILEANGVAANIRYAPLCTMPGLEKHIVGVVGVRHDPYEWMNRIDHKAEPDDMTPAKSAAMGERIPQHVFGPASGYEFRHIQHEKFWGIRGDNAKVFNHDCAHCQAVSVCDGFDPRYALERNPKFIPHTKVRGEIVQDQAGGQFTGPLDIDRLTYKAPFFVKLKPDAKMKEIVSQKIKPRPFPENPTVAIIIAHYEQPLIDRAIKSALAQTHKCQVIVADDCSKELPTPLSEPGSDLVIIAENAHHAGQPAVTRNTGIILADADFILCLDADDWIEPTMIEECLDTLHQNPHASIAYPGCYAHGKTNGVWPNGPWSYRNHLMQNQFVYCSLYKREVWEAVGGYATNVRGCEDFDFWVKAASLGYEAVPVSRALFHYRENAEGIYEKDVVPNFDTKYRQIILNRPEPFPAAMVAQARAGTKIDRVLE